MTKTNNIEVIINQRLQLETNKRILAREFNIPFASMTKLSDKFFLNKFKNWDEKTRNRFVVTVGGRTNFKTTLDYFEQKVKGL